jgi:hypothetical protein
VAFIGAFSVLVRYHESADAKHVDNQKGTDKELKENLEKYPGRVPRICFLFCFWDNFFQQK